MFSYLMYGWSSTCKAFMPIICTTYWYFDLQYLSLFFFEAGRSCFPSTATVKVENGKSLAMSELQIGDKVQTGISIKKFILFLILETIVEDTLKW